MTQIKIVAMRQGVKRRDRFYLTVKVGPKDLGPDFPDKVAEHLRKQKVSATLQKIVAEPLTVPVPE